MTQSDFKKSELVNNLYKRFDENQASMRLVVELILEAMTEGLSWGNRIEVREFGSLYTRGLKAGKARNPKTGESVIVGDRRRILFKCSKNIIKKLNSKS